MLLQYLIFNSLYQSSKRYIVCFLCVHSKFLKFCLKLWLSLNKLHKKSPAKY
jgi:hypothetical protein